MRHATGDDLCSKFTESQTESTSDIQRRTLSLSKERKKCSTVMSWHAWMSQNGDLVLPSLPRPSVCPATHLQEAMIFWGEKRTTINPYSWLVLSDTHCTHSCPPFPSCSQNGYGDEHNAHSVYPWCTYRIYIEWRCSMQSNHLITQSWPSFFFSNTLTSLRYTWHDPSQDSVGHTKHFSWEPV